MEYELLPEGASGAPEDLDVGASAHHSKNVGTMDKSVEENAVPDQHK